MREEAKKRRRKRERTCRERETNIQESRTVSDPTSPLCVSASVHMFV